MLVSYWLIPGTDFACSWMTFGSKIFILFKNLDSRFGRSTTNILFIGFDLNWIFVLALFFVAPVTQSVLLVALFFIYLFICFLLFPFGSLFWGGGGCNL